MGVYTTIDITMAEEGSEMLYDMSLFDLLDMEIISVSKKAERLQDVPSAIYVITSEDIANSTAQNLFQLLRDNVPGFWGVSNDYRNVDGFFVT